jgi:hypothetical protein
VVNVKEENYLDLKNLKRTVAMALTDVIEHLYGVDKPVLLGNRDLCGYEQVSLVVPAFDLEIP